MGTKDQDAHMGQASTNIPGMKWRIGVCIGVGSIICLIIILGGLCWLNILLNKGAAIVADNGYDVEEVTETTASINKNDDDDDKTNIEQKRENADTYTEENEFDEELYDKVQGFSDQDESDSFSYQMNANIDYLQAYSSIVEEVWHSYDEYCEYTLFDLDQDGIKELITSQGTCDADWTNDVYTIEDGYVSMIGQFYGPVMLYVAEDGNGLYAVYGHMGVQNIDQITKNGGQLQVDTIMNGDIGEDDYYSNDNPVNFITVTDASQIMLATADDTEQEKGKILLNDLYIDTIFASSKLTDNTNTYKAEALLDGNTETCWAEGVDGDGEGEYIEIYFLNPVYLTDILLLNGYMKNEDVFNNNGKIKKIELGYSDGSSHWFELKECTYPDIEGQAYSDWISYDAPIYTEYLRITIREAVSGEKYEDTCLSELGLWGYVDSN